MTNVTDCCRSVDTGESGIGNWFFPNGTQVPSPRRTWDFYRTRGQSVVRLQRRRGGTEGIYLCEIPDANNVIQTIYIGVYSEGNGKPSLTKLVWPLCKYELKLSCSCEFSLCFADHNVSVTATS